MWAKLDGWEALYPDPGTVMPMTWPGCLFNYLVC